MTRRLAFAVFAISAALFGQDFKLPAFDRFPATPAFVGKPAPVVFVQKRHRQYRTAIREAVAKGPNFAGHYTIARWGCGAGCIGGAVVDLKTGTVLDLPFQVVVSGIAGLSYADGTDMSSPSFEPIEFRADSRLLIVRGCPDEDLKRCGLYAFEWTDPKFRILSQQPAKQLDGAGKN